MQVGVFGVLSEVFLPQDFKRGSISASLFVRLKAYPLYAVPKSIAMMYELSIVETVLKSSSYRVFMDKLGGRTSLNSTPWSVEFSVTVVLVSDFH